MAEGHEAAMQLSGKSVLVIGCAPLMLEGVRQELAELGIAMQVLTVAGIDDGAAVAAADVVAFGAAVDEPTRARLRQLLGQQHFTARFADLSGPQLVWPILNALQPAKPGAAVDLAAYCRRIGYTGALQHTLPTLRRLLELHPAAIAYENIDVLLDRGIDITPAAVDDKLIARRRGGYCYEHNGLLKRVLTAIGFRVEGLAARVQWMAPPGTPPRRRSHMALRVWLDDVPWLADAGFGSCVPTAPLRLDTVAPQPTGHETFRVIPCHGALLVQACINEVWRPLYELANDPQLDGDYEPLNWFAAMHPTSHFRDGLKVSRTTPEARYTLLNGKLGIRQASGESETRMLDAAGLERALAEVFGLPVEPAWREMIAQAAAASPEKAALARIRAG